MRMGVRMGWMWIRMRMWRLSGLRLVLGMVRVRM